MAMTNVNLGPGSRPGGAAQSLAIEIQGLHKSFGSVEAVKGINLNVAPGEVVAFLGPNGAGKTTTIDVILGLSQPTAGQVSVFGMQPRQAISRGLVSAVMQTGGLLKDLATLGTITHTIAADSVSIEFSDSATRIWSVAKQRVFTYNDGVVITTTGTHSDGTNTNVSMWGANRYGNTFETLIIQPKVIAQSCDYQLTSGETETIRPAVTTTITYGLDSDGNPTGCPVNGGYYYYKETWTINGKTYTWIAPY